LTAVTRSCGFNPLAGGGALQLLYGLISEPEPEPERFNPLAGGGALQPRRSMVGPKGAHHQSRFNPLAGGGALQHSVHGKRDGLAETPVQFQSPCGGRGVATVNVGAIGANAFSGSFNPLAGGGALQRRTSLSGFATGTRSSRFNPLAGGGALQQRSLLRQTALSVRGFQSPCGGRGVATAGRTRSPPARLPWLVVSIPLRGEGRCNLWTWLAHPRARHWGFNPLAGGGALQPGQAGFSMRWLSA